MYVPRHFAMDDDELTALVRAVGAADFVTVGPDGTPESSLLPVLLDLGRGVAIAHMARANPQWTHLPVAGSPALAIVSAPQAYVSPSWYASKVEHGRVVPTWNYSAVHLTGVVTVHDDLEWVRAMVTALSVAHEGHRPVPWTIEDAPAAFIEGQLRAIVGIELQLESVTGKAKLSQNRSQADRAGVVAGLAAERTSSADGVAASMRSIAGPGRSFDGRAG